MDEPIPERTNCHDPAKAKKLVKDATKYIVVGEQLKGFFFPVTSMCGGRGIRGAEHWQAKLPGEVTIADIEEQLHGVCEEMMSKVRISTHVITRAVALYHLTLTVLQVGCGYPGPIFDSTRASEIPDCGNRLFHKVDRSGTDGHDIGGKDQTFLLEEDNLPIRLANGNSLRQ
ncbi:hypothetical protein CR513_11316, partial [Mucuna pruriens]